MHLHMIEDNQGDLIDLIYFCSDFCHRQHVGDKYAGWNGAHEGPDYPEWCAECGDRINVGLETECDEDCLRHDECEHGYPNRIAVSA